MNPIQVEIREVVKSLGDTESYSLIDMKRPFEGKYGLYGVSPNDPMQRHIIDVTPEHSPQILEVSNTDKRIREIIYLGGVASGMLLDHLGSLSFMWIDKDAPMGMNHRHGETIAWIAAEMCFTEHYIDPESEEVEDADNVRSLIQGQGGFVHLMNTISHIGKWAADKFILLCEENSNADYYIFMESFIAFLRTGHNNFTIEFTEEFYQLSSETRLIEQFHQHLKSKKK